MKRTRKERRAEGKALRDKCAKNAHASWKPHSKRPDPIELLIESSKGRIQELVPIRYGRMMQSPFAFYRGAAAISAIDLELRGVLASIGIIKGQPFKPTAKQQELLKKAVETAPKMILAMRQLGRPDKRQLYYKDRQYENVWDGATSDNFQSTYLDIDQRAAYYQIAFSSAPTYRRIHRPDFFRP